MNLRYLTKRVWKYLRDFSFFLSDDFWAPLYQPLLILKLQKKQSHPSPFSNEVYIFDRLFFLYFRTRKFIKKIVKVPLTYHNLEKKIKVSDTILFRKEKGENQLSHWCIVGHFKALQIYQSFGFQLRTSKTVHHFNLQYDIKRLWIMIKLSH